MFLRREEVKNTEVYGGVDVAETNFHLLAFLDFSVLFVEAKFHYNSPGLLAFMGEKAGVLEMLSVVMSLCCTSPQGGTG